MIKKIAITGGPCGGKSTALSAIKVEFENLGYKVIIIGETATEMLSSGVKIEECGQMEFQKNLLLLQLEKEKRYFDLAKILDEKFGKVLIVCDRGVMDGSAYLEKKQFAKIQKSVGTNIVELRDNYDGVFHLVTAADGAKDFYTLENNAVRSETPNEAKALDERIISAWCGHPHLRIIDNSTDFDKKIKRLITEIKSLLGEPEPLEIERKFLIGYPDLDYLEILPNCHKISIEQKYCTFGGKNFRVRRRGENNEFVYFKSEKISISDTTRIEIETRISEDEYNSSKEVIGVISKDRYCLVYENKYFEIDVFPFWKDKALMEIELIDENETFILPDFIKVIREVTDDANYRNFALATNKNK